METAAEFVPDVVVSDIGMSEEDGYWLLKKLRCLAGGKGGKLRAIALTAYAREEDRAMALKAGFDRHLAKPVQLDVLVETIVSLKLQAIAN
ncbi:MULTISPECIES: response regulator [unclassified Microcoleus]|uniref:response regulator n=1 Tax=unclassified Microcoleus TaxID=2642155 RepID=UPI002FD0D510